MLPKQVRRPVLAVFNLLTASTLVISQTPAPAAEIGASVFGPEGQDSFLISQRQLVKQWLKPSQYMPVSEIKPGMEGYGLSVFQGTRPERFNFKVVGVVKKVLNGRDAILVHLGGPQLGRCNVVRGMSGSPLYINNRLIGAISYGFDFSMEPIAGVTPIADMLDALSYEENPNPHEASPNRISAAPSQALPPDVVKSIRAAGGGAAVTQAAGGAPHLVPLMAPISLAGFSPRAQEFLSERMQSQGMWCGSGAGGALDPSLAKLHAGTTPGKDLVPPGGALSVMLTTGDFNSSACGTATATFGNHVLAFGHPFMSAGTVEFPMATAYIHQVLPNYSVSFKVASPMQVIGSFEADRPWAVSGEIGKTAKMIPVTYTVTDETRHIKRVYHANVVDHPDLTPELVAATAMSAIDTTHQSSGPYVLKVKSNIDATGIGPIERTDRYSNNFTAHGGAHKIHFGMDPVGSYLMSTTAKIMDNEFEQASIKSVNLDISLQDGHNAAKIERVYIDKPFVAPGDSLDVHCVLHPYNHALITKTLTLQVPRDVPDGNILIGVSSGDDIDYVRKRLGLVDPPAENLNQIAKKIRDAGSGDNLTAVLALPHQSILVGGTVLPDPPAHWAKLFFSDRYTRGPSLVKAEVRTTQPEEYLIDGSHILTVEVRRPDKALTRSQPYLASASGSYSNGDGLYMTDLARKTMESSRKADTPGSNGATNMSADKPATAQTFWASTKDYPHMRSLLVWQQESNADFNQGKTDSTTIDSWGRITPALQDVAHKSIDNDMRIWSSAWAVGNFWFATTDKIYRWKGDDSAPVVVAKVKGLAIPTMVADSTGTIYFSSVPGGQIMAIDGNAKGDIPTPQPVAKLTEQIVTSLCVDSNDNLYAGVASSGKVYKLPPPKDHTAARTPTMLFDSGQADVSCLFYSNNDKRLYIGTAELGNVYSLDAAGAVRAEYQSPDHIVTGIVRDSKGDLYISTAASGHLVKLSANGAQSTLATSEAFYTLFYDRATDCVYSGDGEGDITQAQTDPISHESYFIPVCHTEQEAVLALASDGKGRLFSGTSNLAVARTFEMKPASPAVYTSTVKDAGRKAKWSRLRAYGAYNEVSDLIAKTVQIESRSGEISQPDETWSNWQSAKYADGAFVIASPAGRYMQYRLTWRPDQTATRAGAHAKAPVSIGKVEVTYLPANVAPEFTSISLKTGTACSAKQDVTITANDPDGDNLALTIEASADGAKTWIPLVSNLRSHHASKEAGHPASEKAVESKKTETNSNSEKSGGGKVEKKDEPKEGGTAQSQKDTNVESGGANPAYESQDSLSDSAVELDADKPADPDADKDKDKDKDKDSDKDTNKEAKRADKGDSDKSSGTDDKTAKVIVKETKPVRAKAKLPAGQPLAQLKAPEPSTTGEKFAWNWDTAKLKDGNYVLKLTLDDLPSNPSGHLQTVALRTIEVDNSPPEITAVKLTKGKGLSVGSLSVKAHDKFTPIVNATYRFDEGEPFALGNPDNITDGLDAQFEVTDLTIPHGSHKLEVQVTNEAGNTATKTVNVN